MTDFGSASIDHDRIEVVRNKIVELSNFYLPNNVMAERSKEVALIKSELCESYIQILDRLSSRNSIASVKYWLDSLLDHMSDSITQVLGQLSELKLIFITRSLAISQVNQAERLISEIEDVYYSSMEYMAPFFAIIGNDDALGASEKIEEVLKKAVEDSRLIEKLRLETEKSAEDIVIMEGAKDFQGLVEHHEWHESLWLRLLVLSFITLIGACWYTIFGISSHDLALSCPDDVCSPFWVYIAPWIFSKIIILSLCVAFTKVCLTRYTYEKSLRMAYGHKVEALRQFRMMSASIPDDSPVNMGLKLEVLKFIFVSPEVSVKASDFPVSMSLGSIDTLADLSVKPSS